MEKRVVFRNRWLPYLLVAPQIFITLVFFFWPAGEAVYQSVFMPDPFGLKTRYVGLANFQFLFTDPYYRNSFADNCALQLPGLHDFDVCCLMAGSAGRPSREKSGRLHYPSDLALCGGAGHCRRPVDVSVHAVHRSACPRSCPLRIYLEPCLNGGQAMTLVVIASAWKQISYNFLFFLAGLQSIPRSLIEAAAIDGASFTRSFLDHCLSPVVTNHLFPPGGQCRLRLF